MKVASKLVIEGVEVSFFDQIPISTNFSVADIKDPDKRQTTYTKTIAIPGTKEVIEIFEYSFGLNVQTSSFNPNKKLSAKYYYLEEKIFEGGLQLLNIEKKYSGTTLELTFNCSIIAETGSIFLDIADLFLTDIDFSDLNHNLVYNTSLFNPTLGQGYCYPYIDYGLDANGGIGYNWNFEHLKPAIFELEYLRRIFVNAGYTWTSSYLNSSYEKSIIIPDVNEGALQLSNAQLQNVQFVAGRSANIAVNTPGSYSASTTPPGWIYNNGANNIFAPLPFNDDTSTGLSDPGNIFNTSTSEFTIPINGYYNITCALDVQLKYNLPATGVSISGLQQVVLIIERFTTSSGVWVPIASNIFTLSVGPTSNTFNYSISANIPGNYYTNTNGDKFRCRLRYGAGSRLNISNSSGTLVTTGTSSLDVIMLPSSRFYSIMANSSISYGNPVDMNTTIPKEVKQIYFLMSIIKSENLYIDIDPSNPKNYIIERRDDFYLNNTSKDWTQKQDLSSPITILPMGSLDAKKYTFAYKEDGDAFNQLYQDKYKETYGTHNTYVENDFVKTENKINIIFSATPGVSIQTDIVAPRFYKNDNGAVSPMQVNIRRLFWGGLINCDLHNIIINGVFTGISQYPYAGHLDNPLLPTVDLNFDNPKEIYFNLPAQQWTNNNLYNRGYSKMIQEITDRDSKIVVSNFVLTSSDIAAFSFRDLIFVEDTYFRVNSISDYDPQQIKPVKVELLKLKKGQTFIPANYTPANVPPGQNVNRIVQQTPGFNSGGNYSNGNSFAAGSNAFAFGQNNFVQGSNVSAGEGISGFVGIGMKDYTPIQSDVVSLKNDAMVVATEGVKSSKIARSAITSDFKITDDVQCYLVDCTGGNIIGTMPSVTSNNSKYTVIRVDDGSNTLTMKGALGTEDFRSVGVSFTSDSVPGYTRREYFTDYENWYY